MTAKQKGTDWYSASAKDRKKKITGFTLSDEARARLVEIAKARKLPRSQVVEALIMAAPLLE